MSEQIFDLGRKPHYFIGRSAQTPLSLIDHDSYKPR
jgi:hypothetical protein